MVRAYLPQHSTGSLTTNTNTPPQGTKLFFLPPGFRFWIDNFSNTIIDNENDKFIFVDP